MSVQAPIFRQLDVAGTRRRLVQRWSRSGNSVPRPATTRLGTHAPVLQTTTLTRRHNRQKGPTPQAWPAVEYSLICSGLRVVARPSDDWTLQNGGAEEQGRRLPFLNPQALQNGTIRRPPRSRFCQNCYESISFRQAGFSGVTRKRIL